MIDTRRHDIEPLRFFAGYIAPDPSASCSISYVCFGFSGRAMYEWYNADNNTTGSKYPFTSAPRYFLGNYFDKRNAFAIFSAGTYAHVPDDMAKDLAKSKWHDDGYQSLVLAWAYLPIGGPTLLSDPDNRRNG